MKRKKETNFQKPIIIIGAGRSGTNILRDILCTVPGLETWPCDEINYIWRHGNKSYPTDELEKKHATLRVKKYIRNAFADIQEKYNADTVVEKTCANSLRVRFVNEIFSDAKFIHIIRDGRDVVNSARKRWKADLNIGYILKKARYVPKSDIPYYAWNYLKNRVNRLFSSENRLSTWGPNFEGMDEMSQDLSIEEICAYQWKRCIEKADHDLAQLNHERVHNITYADLIRTPDRELETLLQFLDIDIHTIDISSLAAMLHSDSLHKWKDQLNEEQVDKIMGIIKPTLEKFDFE